MYGIVDMMDEPISKAGCCICRLTIDLLGHRRECHRIFIDNPDIRSSAAVFKLAHLILRDG